MSREEFLKYFRDAHYALHRCWTKAVDQPDYVKADWQAIDNALGRFARDYATEIGIDRSAPPAVNFLAPDSPWREARNTGAGLPRLTRRVLARWPSWPESSIDECT